MPLEGHYERQTTPLYKLSPREIKVAIAIIVVTLVTIVGMVIATAGDSNPPPALGCINPTVAGIVGAETLNRCGQEAVDTCSHAAEFTGARAETIVANCEKQQVKF
jgi:hypothetical protein